jgi:hypothetical protein
METSETQSNALCFGVAPMNAPDERESQGTGWFLRGRWPKLCPAIGRSGELYAGREFSGLIESSQTNVSTTDPPNFATFMNPSRIW